ncbi:MAG: hypothetical protein ACJ76I_14855 [Gaiellaceae bacterium]
MRRFASASTLVASLLVLAGCAHARPLSIAADPPPSPTTWKPYPAFPSRSCWARPSPGGGNGELRSAPSVAPRPASSPATPAAIVRELLAGLGDRRYVRRIEFGPPPPITRQHLKGWFNDARPPATALWAYIGAPAASAVLTTHANPQQIGAQSVAEWEGGLVEGALRDRFCSGGGAPLVGWSLGGIKGVSDRAQPFGQRFPNPTPAAFRTRVDAIGRRYGFDVVSLRLLRPLQIAPLLVVKTSRDRKAFVADVPAIMHLLDPIASGGGSTAVTFEGFLLEADDGDGPFVRVDNLYRGQVEGGQWSWNRCVYPYAHSEPFGAKPC